MVLIVLGTFMLSSCGGSDVDKVVGIINDTAEQVSKFKGDEEDSRLDEFVKIAESKIMKYANSKQELTDENRKALAQALVDMKAAGYKAFENEDMTASMKNREFKIIINELEEYNTLGEALQALIR